MVDEGADVHGWGARPGLAATRIQNFDEISRIFGGGRKKNMKFHITRIHVLCNNKLIFSIAYVAYSST
jgi:hypothetical protein